MRRVIPLLLLLGCSSSGSALPASDASLDSAPLPELPWAPSPRFDEVFALATHNAYWVDRGAPHDSFASGTSERLLDQLLYDGARSLEIDIHKDGMKVFHTVAGNSLCDDLKTCLGHVRAFEEAVPEHDPLVIVLELKELFAPNFDDAHRPEALDAELRASLPTLYAPADLMARCPGSTTLGDCTRRARWPSFAELRGRVLVAVIGNWDELGAAQSTKDWADYAARAPSRAAFPMASPWKLDASTFTPRLQEIVTQAELDLGWSQSAFVQIEDLDDPRADEALARGAIVRVDGASSIAEQEARISRGFQLLQTDTPWVRAKDRGLRFPYGPSTPPEPGSRLLLAPSSELAFAWSDSTAIEEWQTFVASGQDARRIGCLRGSVSLTDPKLGAITICREKLAAERVRATIEVCRDGTCATTALVEPEAGDRLRLRFSSDTCAVPGARAVTRWTDGEEACFPMPLRYRGLARPPSDLDSGPVLFAAPRVGERTLRAADLTGPDLIGMVIDESVP